MDFASITYEVGDRIATITLNRLWRMTQKGIADAEATGLPSPTARP
jgi:hypothetical protein